MRSLLPVLLAGLVAGLVSWFIVRAERPGPFEAPAGGVALAPAEAPRDDGGLAELLARLERLEEERLVAPQQRQPASPNPAGDPADPSQLAELLARIERLEATVYGGGWRAAAPIDEARELQRARIEALAAAEQDVEARKLKMAEVILDPNATEEEKLSAHRQLRRVEDAYTPGMIDALVNLGQTAQDPDVRASTWTQFDGSTIAPEVLPHLMNAARGDSAYQARREAAETLGNYTEDPGVIALLEDLAQNDPHQEVRERARRTLGEANGSLPSR